MPGIYGVYHKWPNINKDATDKLFSAMGRILHHRKSYTHHEVKLDNLSIGKISFSNDPGCVGPVWNVDHSIVLFLDGAIFSYNDESGSHEVDDYHDIFARLMSEFRDSGTIDTKKLNGEFNLAVYDVEMNRLLIANDRWGFRELYYYKGNDYFLFASEIKALLRYSGIERKLDEQGVADFLNYGHILADRTLVEGISLLSPASVMTIEETGLKLETRKFFYKPTLPLDNFDDYVDTAYRLFDQAVQRRLRGRRKIAACLSGGLDSRIVTAIIANHVPRVDTYTFGTNKKGKEYAIAKKVARTIQGCNNSLAKTMPEHIIKYLNWAVWASDGSLSSLSSVSVFLGALAKPLINHDLLLGGFVGDLIVGGSFTKKEEFGDIPLDKRIEKMKFRVGAKHLRPFVKTLFSEEFGGNLDFYAVRSVEEEFGKISDSVNFFPFQQDLFVILTRCRRGYNVNRGLIGHLLIEEYYPFFDNDLFDFLYSLPPETRINHKLYIEIYKRYFPVLAEVPWLKTGVSLYDKESGFNKEKKILMHKIRWYVKRGTLGRVNLADKNQYAPENEWYRTNKVFRNFVNDILLDDRTIARGYFCEDGIKTMLHKIRTGWDYMPLVGRLCTFELWCRLFLDGDEKLFSSGYDFEKDVMDA